MNEFLANRNISDNLFQDKQYLNISTKRKWREKFRGNVNDVFKLNAELEVRSVGGILPPGPNSLITFNQAAPYYTLIDIKTLNRFFLHQNPSLIQIMHWSELVPFVDLWLGLQLQWTARFGQQWKSADTVQDRCSSGCQHRPGKNQEQSFIIITLCISVFLFFSYYLSSWTFTVISLLCAGCLWICTYIGTYRRGVGLRLGCQLVRAVGNRQ